MASELRSTPPSGFIENLGQYDPEARFFARTKGAGIFFTDRDVRFALDSGEAVFMRFVDASPFARIEVGEPLPGLHHFLRGNDPSKWVRDARTFDSVLVRDLYPGIDIRWFFADGSPEYDLIARPGADLGRVQIEFEGVLGIEAGNGGALILRTRYGAIAHSAITAFTRGTDAESTSIPASIQVEGQSLRFTLGGVPILNTEVVFDPNLDFSTYFGWSNVGDVVFDAEVGFDGSIYLTGFADSFDFPITPGVYTTGPVVPSDPFVSRLSSDGSSLIYSTAIGGSWHDETARTLVVQSDGTVVVSGVTSSPDFPTTTNAYLTSKQQGFYDAFAFTLSDDGSSLVGSTYFGGPAAQNEGVSSGGLATDSLGRIYITGEAQYGSLPTTPDAVSPSHQGGGSDAYLAILNTDCSILYHCTYIGGAGSERHPSLAVDDAGGIYVSGENYFGQFPVTQGAYDTTFNSINTTADFFLIKLKPMGQGVRYATYLGASESEFNCRTGVTPNGEAILVGQTFSSFFPSTPNSFDPTYDGISSIIVARFNSQGSTLLSSGFAWGGDLTIDLRSMKVDVAGGVYLTARSDTPANFPYTPDAFDSTANGSHEAAFARIDPAGSKIVYASFLGGSGQEEVWALGVDSNRRVVIAGTTNSTDFPVTPGCFQPALTPTEFVTDNDSFVSVFDLCNGSFQSYGNPCSGASPAPSLTGSGCPAAGGNVTLACSAAVPGSPAALFLGLGTGSLPLHPSCALQIAPIVPSFALLFSIPLSGSLALTSTLPVPLPTTTLHFQFLVADPTAAAGIAASAPLRMILGD